jgi:hypothetical protein
MPGRKRELEASEINGVGEEGKRGKHSAFSYQPKLPGQREFYRREGAMRRAGRLNGDKKREERTNGKSKMSKSQ